MDERAPHYILTFDGGSKGNPGLGYGSYELRTCDDRARMERREYGDNVTNNEAEYRTLIEGLDRYPGHPARGRQGSARLPGPGPGR